MYYLYYSLLWLFSLLPLRVLYWISNGCYYILFYMVKYRREVVMKNLLIAFPEKTEEERLVIAKKFYRNLTDTFLETIKSVSAPGLAARRVKANWNVANNFYDSGESVQLHLGHNFNWEWANFSLAKGLAHKVLIVYMPMTNKTMEKLFFNLRKRTGIHLLKATDMRNSFEPFRRQQYLLALVADQNPGHPGNAWWINFFGRPTPFVKGPAKAALTNKTKVVYCFIHKPKRGHYEAVLSVPDIDLETCTEQELTIHFVRYLEDIIRKYPDMWLWSHRRWKWNYDPSFGPVLNT